jgi:hypothetical protein
MKRSFDEIVALYHERRRQRAPEFAIAEDVRRQYDGDVVIPLPGLDQAERPGVANLLSLGLDQTAMRVNSTSPDMYFSPTRQGKKEEKDAETRHKAMVNIHEANNLDIKDGRRARLFIGMATAPMLITPDFKLRIPRYELLDPLRTYPAPTSDYDDMCPCDVIFSFDRPLGWLKQRYPEAMFLLARVRGEQEKDTDLFTVLQYVDDEEIVMGVIGKRSDPIYERMDGSYWEGQPSVEMMRAPNKADQCTVIVPGRTTLGRRHGQFDGMLGMYQQQAMLQALSVIATKKGVFPDEWIIARANETPEIVRVANGLKGQIGEIIGADIKVQPTDPSYQTPQMIDRLERYQRVDGGVPAQFGGENPTNVRTGRASDGALSATIDFTVAEAQKVLARSRQYENKAAIAVDKAYWNGPKSFYVSWKGETKSLEYRPKDLWKTDEHKVKYAHAGVDENGRTIEIGQMLGMELIATPEARRLHPLIDDPDKAGDEVMYEAIQKAMLSGLQTAAAQPGANVADFAVIMKKVKYGDKDLADAIIETQQEAQQRQASQDSQGQPTGVDPNSPEAQPGLAAPGQGAEAGIASVAGPSQGVSNVADLFARTRQPARITAAEQGGGAA